MLWLNILIAARALAFRPTVVLSMHVRCAWGAQVAARLTGARWVQYYHAKEVVIFDRSTRRAVRHAAAHVAVSSYTSGLVVAAGASPDSVVVVPPAVLSTEADVVGSDRQQREDAVAPNAAPTLVTVSRLADRYKGHDVVVKALGAVVREVPDLRWVVVGDGPLRGPLQDLVADAGLCDHVQFAGSVSDKRRDNLLRSADVFVLPSRVPPGGLGGEGFGIVYLEAAAAGLPVIAGDQGGAVDAVAHDVTGLLVDATSPTQVAKALISILTDPDKSASMAANGPAWARSFTWDRLIADLREVLVPAGGR